MHNKPIGKCLFVGIESIEFQLLLHHTVHDRWPHKKNLFYSLQAIRSRKNIFNQLHHEHDYLCMGSERRDIKHSKQASSLHKFAREGFFKFIGLY